MYQNRLGFIKRKELHLCLFYLDGSIIFHTLFGVSTTFWMALLTRFLLGSCNGMLGPVKVRNTSIMKAVDVFVR